MKIAAAAALTAAALVALTATPAVAASTPRPSNAQGATVTLASATVAAGSKIRLTGTGWVNDSDRGQVVTVKLDDNDILGEFTASDSGALSGSVTIPAATEAGSEHWLRLLAGSGQENDTPARSLASSYFAVTTSSGSGTTSTSTATATATATSTSTGSGTLAKTGIDAGPWLGGAILLPVAGIALLLVERRRRRAGA
ncbi:hypothetical protein [Actinoplanes sp. NPDC051851]|uniref:hypothetical protein n=1 Tax=Actinoplanes sp. NPDC051851 TaxID=3154753 RepID=UPI0034199167